MADAAPAATDTGVDADADTAEIAGGGDDGAKVDVGSGMAAVCANDDRLELLAPLTALTDTAGAVEAPAAMLALDAVPVPAMAAVEGRARCDGNGNVDGDAAAVGAAATAAVGGAAVDTMAPSPAALNPHGWRGSSASGACSACPGDRVGTTDALDGRAAARARAFGTAAAPAAVSDDADAAAVAIDLGLVLKLLDAAGTGAGAAPAGFIEPRCTWRAETDAADSEMRLARLAPGVAATAAIEGESDTRLARLPGLAACESLVETTSRACWRAAAAATSGFRIAKRSASLL